MKNEMTDKSYWESNYEHSNECTALPNLEDFRELPSRRVVNLIEGLGISGKRVLEVGAGNSTVLALLAQRNISGCEFSGLDYTEKGCEKLRNMARRYSLSIDVIQANMFSPDKWMFEQYDVVYSYGVVEHFRELGEVTTALRQYLSPDGVMVTIIPNMRGVMGTLTRVFSRRVYDLHNPHSLDSLVDGHKISGLEIVDSGYLCSSNFGILASCVTPKMRVKWNIYLWLGRLSKGAWYFESRFGDFFRARFLSPYIYVVAKNRL